ncbi:unnamed protein product [Mytilus edulis]|uniref:Uncharacterized protein n=1 Tax=Mytilus edulis TaxID=6550 RepID=A0A8S3TYG4_MYTED|nr:unnamed protein product [Mytilus edulis]
MDQILSEVKKEYEEMSSNDMVECGLWDFAGQKEYYVTHQTFLTQNAIYLIVADLTEDIVTRKMEKDLNYKGIGEHIQFWFDSIHCFCKDTSTDHHLNPPVILVCTGTDKINKISENITDIDDGQITENITDIDDGQITENITDIDDGQITENITDIDDGQITENITDMDNGQITENITDIDYQISENITDIDGQI